MVGHRHRLGEALRLVVHAAWTDRVDVTPVALVLRVYLRIAVDLARGGEQVAGAVALASPSVLWVPRDPTFRVLIGYSR